MVFLSGDLLGGVFAIFVLRPLLLLLSCSRDLEADRALLRDLDRSRAIVTFCRDSSASCRLRSNSEIHEHSNL